MAPERIVTSGHDGVGTELPAQLAGKFQSELVPPVQVFGLITTFVVVVYTDHTSEAATV